MTAALPGDEITILHAQDGKRLAKLFTVATNGVVIRRDFDGATFFSAETVPVAGIRDLCTILRRIEAHEGACIIRGALADGIDPARVRRKKNGADALFSR